jgi:hypothetical protein
MCVRFAEGRFVSTGKCFWGKQVSRGHRREAALNGTSEHPWAPLSKK